MIKDLNNTEISLVYYQFKSYLNQLEETLEQGYRTERLDIGLEEGLTVQPYVVIKISKEEENAFRNTDHYKSVRSIVDKLHPIIELIEEAEPDIKKRLDE